MSRGAVAVLAALVTSTQLSGPGGAAARAASAEVDDKEACARAYEAAQRLRRKGELRASRQRLLECARAACPAVLTRDCGDWLREVDAALPTVVPIVVDEGGVEVADARLLIDGDLVATKLERTALEVDPGAHVFRVEVPSKPPHEETIEVREGERQRALTLSLGFAPLAVGRSGEGPASRAEAAEDARRARGDASPLSARFTAPVVALGATSVASAVAFALFATSGVRKENALEACRPVCDEADVRAARRTFLVADVFLGLSALTLAGGAYYFFKTPKKSAPASVWIAPPVPVAGGVHGAVGARFAP